MFRRTYSTIAFALTISLIALTAPVASALAGGTPAEVGQWQPPQEWPVVTIHTAVMPTGGVLQYAYPAGPPGSQAMVYDPELDSFTNVVMNSDIFCSGLSLLPDGKVYVVGGNDYDCEFQGRRDRWIFDPFTNQWTQLPDMATGRWYPTNVTLGDGRVITVSGLNTDCETTNVMEIYEPGGDIEMVFSGFQYFPLFPRLHLLTSGDVVSVGPTVDTLMFDTEALDWSYVTNSSVYRWNGSSVHIPGDPDRIMVLAGEYGSDVKQIHNSTCEIIDFNDANPQYQPTGSMHHPRAHANVVILPDSKILIIGGGTDGLYGSPINVPEMYDPDTGSWTELPSHVYGRMYHSTAVLLPDGRVLVSGQDNGPSQNWGEIYEPPYLFRGQRPVIADAPDQLVYDATFDIQTPDAADITEVVMVRLASMTHSVNMEQRLLNLDFTYMGGTTLVASTPVDGNHAPPGYYMLFILNGQGVPSEAPMVQMVNSTVCMAHIDCADADGDGRRDDNCVWWECNAGACNGVSIPFGDMGGSNGACFPDQAADGNDRFHALNCFSNQSTQGVSGYPCENFPPQAMRVDAGGEFGSCISDGVCDGNDAFHALNAFNGSTTCSCSGPAPSIEQPPRVAGQAHLRLVPSQDRASADSTIEVDVYLDGPVDDLRGYQLDLAVRARERSPLHVDDPGVLRPGFELIDITVQDRDDAALPPGAWQAFNVQTEQMVSGLDGPGVATTELSYLATYTYRIPKYARGTYTVTALHPDGAEPGRSYLFPTAAAGKIEITAVDGADVAIVGRRIRSRARHGTAERIEPQFEVGPLDGGPPHAEETSDDHDHAAHDAHTGDADGRP